MPNKQTAYALVLAGGKSKRMGKDKSRIIYHQKEQMYEVADMLLSMGLNTSISINKTQQKDLDPNYSYLIDAYEDQGALGGILTAMELHPNKPLMVVGCDYPMLQRWDLNHLMFEAQKQKQSMAYQAPDSLLYLPTVAYYTIDMLQGFRQALVSNQLKLQTILGNAKVHKLKPLNSIRFVTANTPEEEKQIRKEIDHE
ncbi:molybdenum cofactor guanylyltransferase [Bacteroidia bacterium]|nr:molybdenum cofactor guanylyltransferase [Bacteroidia bacterium]